ncbi:ammonium transporter [Crenobacter intestini]|uniref:Ammonium transporter n=1 Tax=Crenobacter intestini TaxID=2563443 RepID=A0A4T0UYK5_9NEIS|nr:ammonium transporter [Crenobacter intestini]TIC83775.1 ammonium transporter [Crenobacter intestini]
MYIINTGDTAFIILCTALVCLMTPGLALFYGGLVRSRSMLSIMMQNFICMGVVTVVWIFGGFSLAFGPDVGGLIGDMSFFALNNVSVIPHPGYAPSIPFIMFFAYQMMFAIITPALITGAFAERFSFKAFLAFIVLWILLIYVPVAHWIWGGGFMQKLGVIDFAGGIVVHTTAGFAALATVLFLGKRDLKPGEETPPSNLPIVAVGTGLLWFGWFGFNAGGAYAANGLAAYAFVNTAIAGAVAMCVWLAIAWRVEKKPSFAGVMVGGVAGLATITPTAGYVEPASAVLIGAIGATVCYFAKAVQQRYRFDDALEVFRAHGVGGVTGSLLVGLLANRAVDDVTGGLHQFAIQLLAVVVVAVYSFVVTWIIMKLVHKPRVSPAVEDEGLDKGEFGESAYHFDKQG